MSRTDRRRFEMVNVVAERAFALSQSMRLNYSKMEWLMDIDFADRDIPLKLEQLASAPELDFSHDVFGIRRHLNRETKKLENCFVPRYAEVQS